MPTKEEIEVFDQMQRCMLEIKSVAEESPCGIAFEQDGRTYRIKSESPRIVRVTLAVPPGTLSGVFTREIDVDGYWNFNLADVDKNKVTEQCSFPLVPEHADKLREYLGKLAENSRA
ncbi:MAG: hypothetical protein K2N31_07995 [Treponemataceae bacterium]|nr:hypothetical protein [Treponemataceae bacterium]